MGVDTILQMRIILLIFSILFISQTTLAAAIGTVVYIDGQASAFRHKNEVDLKIGSAIYVNDRIRTTPLSRIRVIIGKQCSIMIYGNSELKIGNEVKDSKIRYLQAALSPVVKTEDARARMIVSQIKTPMECHIVTPNSVLRGLETDVAVSYSHRLGLTEVVTFTGEIELSQVTGKGAVLLKENDLSRVTPESAPSIPIKLSGGQIFRLKDKYSWPINIPKLTNRSLPWRVITKSQQQ